MTPGARITQTHCSPSLVVEWSLMARAGPAQGTVNIDYELPTRKTVINHRKQTGYDEVVME